MPPSIDVILERLDGLDQSIKRVARAVETQNGRVTTIELARAEERGERSAVAQAAAETAAALQAARNVREKSKTWKATIIVTFATALGCVVTVGTLVAHALIYHAL